MKQLVLLLLFIALLCLSSCNSEINSKDKNIMTIIDQNQILIKASMPTLNKEAQEYIACRPKLNELYESLSIKGYKSVNNAYYTIIDIEGEWHLLSFQEDGTFVSDRLITFSDANSEEMIKQIEVGQQLAYVQSVDPDGQYDFLYAGWSDFPKYSYHFYESGNAYYIRYNDSDTVSSITKFTI